MATSAARIEANRRNAQRSTGPRTAEGKAASRWNAFRHGLAGSDDLVADSAEAARVETRAAALIRELGPVGEAGAILARRAAVLSVRMEGAARRELIAVARDRAEAIAEFDQMRADRLAGPLALLRADADAKIDADGPSLADRQRAALRDLADQPDGIAPLIDLWRELAQTLADPDPVRVDHASTRAGRWLALAPESTRGWTPRRWAERVGQEIGRLREREKALEPVRQRLARLREEAGDLATFNPSPEACLARRYEAHAQNSFFRILKTLRDLRRDEVAAPPTPTSAPAPTVKPVAPTTPTERPAPVARPEPQGGAASAELGSFRTGLLPAAPAVSVGPSLAPPNSADHRKRRPDPRKLVASRR